MQLRIGGLALLAVAVASSPAIAGETIHVAVDKMTFDPPKISAHVGDTIEWASSGCHVTPATAKNKDWDAGHAGEGDGARYLGASGRGRLFLPLSSEHDGPGFGDPVAETRAKQSWTRPPGKRTGRARFGWPRGGIEEAKPTIFLSVARRASVPGNSASAAIAEVKLDLGLS